MSEANYDPRCPICAIATMLAQIDLTRTRAHVERLQARMSADDSTRVSRLVCDHEAVLREWNGVREAMSAFACSDLNCRAAIDRLPVLKGRAVPPLPDHESETGGNPAGMYIYARMLARNGDVAGAMQLLAAILPKLESPGCLNRGKIRAKTSTFFISLARMFSDRVRSILTRITLIERDDGKASYFVETWHSTRPDARTCAYCYQKVNFGQVQLCDRDAGVFGSDFAALPDRVVCVPCALEHGVVASNQAEMECFLKNLLHTPRPDETDEILADIGRRRLAVPAMGRVSDAAHCGVIVARDPLGTLHAAFIPLQDLIDRDNRSVASIAEFIRAFSILKPGPLVDFHVHSFLDGMSKLYLPDGITAISAPVIEEAMISPPEAPVESEGANDVLEEDTCESMHVPSIVAVDAEPSECKPADC
jgi:hypothetical protein